MAGSVNKVIIVGNVGKDPELRDMGESKRVATFSVATSESWTDRASGEKKERTEWHRVTVFNAGLVGVIENYVRKGTKVYIEGALQTRKWQDQSGQDRYTTEIVLQQYGGTLVLLGGGGKGEEGGSFGGDYQPPPKRESLHQERAPERETQRIGKRTRSPEPEFDDDIPF